jgi:hypothetical protein
VDGLEGGLRGREVRARGEHHGEIAALAAQIVARLQRGLDRPLPRVVRGGQAGADVQGHDH